MASSAVAGLSGGFITVSQGIWAGAGPALQAGLAATLLAAGTLAAGLSPRSQPIKRPAAGLVSRPSLMERASRLFDSDARASVILCELTGLAWTSRNQCVEAAQMAFEEAQERLSASLPQGALAAQWNDEHFVVLLPASSDPMTALSLARDLCAALTTGPAFANLSTAVTCHAGIALAPTDGTRLCELVNNAELALAEARRQGKPGYGFYAPGMSAAADRRSALQRAVRDAVKSDALRLELQPVYAMRSGELTGFEALIRLHDQELGQVPPSEFIPLAEEAGLIVDIGEWALEEACRVAAQWPPHLVVAVNLSPAQFHSGTLITTTRRALQRHSLPAYRLEVEITEGTLMADSELVLGQLRLLRDMGVGVALDDFGTGYSSLSYLCKFPFSKLKIDRSFAAALDHSASAKNVLRAIVRLGHGLGMTVTAEGIETQRQLSLLRDIGCDLAQGYLLGRPAPLSDLAAIILGNFAQQLARRPRPARRSAA
ncbi:MAG: GGDEF domain-containing phosphodiesterase [Aestuariivirga sp.]|uniref:putative bifunctional diguanylate cyclase/phosphodiesterase n=1 Tax=Aestuariivirga sp. TaxID=2650926 RepID=UPI0030178B2C